MQLLERFDCQRSRSPRDRRQDGTEGRRPSPDRIVEGGTPGHNSRPVARPSRTAGRRSANALGDGVGAGTAENVRGGTEAGGQRLGVAGRDLLGGHPEAVAGEKPLLVMVQVLGYTTSRFLGIRVIAEARPDRGAAGIVGLIAGAEGGVARWRRAGPTSGSSKDDFQSLWDSRPGCPTNLEVVLG